MNDNLYHLNIGIVVLGRNGLCQMNSNLETF